MKITDVQAVALTALWERIFGGMEQVPPVLRRPAAHFQTFPRLGQYAVLVTVTTDDGLKGIGEAWGLPVPEATAALINGYLCSALVGRSAEDIEGIWHDVYKMLASLGYTRGGWMEALSGIDMALWDIRGKKEGCSLSKLLGGTPLSSVPVYVSPVPFLPTPADSAYAAREFVEQGFTALKVKVGREEVQTDLSHLRAVREAVGADVRLMVDVNAGYTVEKTIAFAQEASQIGLEWIEEPVPSEQLEAIAELRRQIAIPVAAGESEFAPRAFADLLMRGRVDILTPNVTRAGGITGVCKIAGFAAENGAILALHGVGGALMRAASLHLSAALSPIEWFECNCLPNPLRDELSKELFPLTNGTFSPPNCLGLGIELDPDVVAHYSVSKERIE
jgi:L-alanine-DL-glutamate epimerase-like enolase superfamily enzyme